MKPTAEVHGLYEQAVALNDHAFTAGQYAVAYHALLAALHCAEAGGDEAQLTDLSRRAKQLVAWVDARVSGGAWNVPRSVRPLTKDLVRQDDGRSAARSPEGGNVAHSVGGAVGP